MKRIQTRAGIFIAFVLLVLSCAMFLSAHPAKAEEIQPVHGIYWIGKMRTDKKATINGQSVYLKKKEKVLVVSRPYDRQGNSIVEKDGVRIPVPYNSISYITDACTINQGDYNTTTKEHFVNVQHHLTSKTRYLIWASLDKQRLNLFEGSGNGGDWKLADATPGEASFSNISAYPNPVRPDYGGPINITGLMENSLIKIADPSGNVIRTLKSTGGMVSWDTCNENGDLVGTGVYTILASHAGGSGGGTTKVLIVR